MKGILHSAQIFGGDIYMKRTLAHSSATSRQALFSELQIAQDYRRYLANKDIIDNIIALDPKSAFAAGWVRPGQSKRRVASYAGARDSRIGRTTRRESGTMPEIATPACLRPSCSSRDARRAA